MRNFVTLTVADEKKNEKTTSKRGESFDEEEEQFFSMMMRFIRKRLRLKNYLGPQHIW